MSADLFDVLGRVAVVTGGGSGIGYMIAETLVKNGAKVYITGRRAAVLQEAARKLNEIYSNSKQSPKVDFFQMDVSTKEDIVKFTEFIGQREDSVDILVNNAGAYRPDPKVTHLTPLEDAQHALSSSSPADWADQYVTNSWAPYTLSASLLHLLVNAAKKGEGRGSIIMIGTIVSKLWNPWWTWTGYAASKAAQDHVSKILLAKLLPHGIRINTVAPGVFPSEYNDPSNEKAPAHKSNLHKIPMGRAGTSDDIGGIILYLSSRASAYVTGQWIAVDGGSHIIANGLNEV